MTTGTAGRPAARTWLIGATLVATAALSALFRPEVTAASARPAVDLAQLVPTRFGHWQFDEHALSTAIGPAKAKQSSDAYAQTLERVYVDNQHRYVMLSIAYSARELGDSLQAHRPEYCYKAQGFTVEAIGDGELTTPRARLPIRRLHAHRPGRSEPVSYWLTVGDLPALPGLSRKLAQLRQGLSGQVPDSLLVRVSSIDAPTPEAYALHDRFLTDLLAAVPKAGWKRFAGPAVHP